MVWAIVVVAIAVLGVAAWAGTGRLGEMPDGVTDRPKAHIPEGHVDQDFLEGMSLPVASTGYRRSQVDEALSSHVSGEPVDADQRFDVVRRGYDMQAVDAILARMRTSAPIDERVDATEHTNGADEVLLNDGATAAVDAVEDERAGAAHDVGDDIEETVPPDDDFERREATEETLSRDLLAP